MKVFVLEHRWDTPDNEGSDIQIYGERCIDAARRAMLESAEKIKAEYTNADGTEPWQPDFTWCSENEVHLGFDPQEAYSLATTYSWEIYEREIQYENVVGELPSVELSTAPLVSEHDVVFAYFDPAKYRIETLKKIHEYLVKVFSHNDVILIPDEVSMMAMPRENAIKQLKGVIAALEEDA